MSIAKGKLVLESEPGKRDNHLVCWLDQEMPAEFLLEFTVKLLPETKDKPLAEE